MELALSAGDGIRAILASLADLQQAADIANRGLLASAPVAESKLRATAERILAFVIADLETLAAR